MKWKRLRWRHNGRDSVYNHQLHDCLLNGLFRRRSKKTTKLHVTGLCGTGEFPAQMASNVENVSTRWRHHGRTLCHTHYRSAFFFVCFAKCQSILPTSVKITSVPLKQPWRIWINKSHKSYKNCDYIWNKDARLPQIMALGPVKQPYHIWVNG